MAHLERSDLDVACRAGREERLVLLDFFMRYVRVLLADAVEDSLRDLQVLVVEIAVAKVRRL